VKEDQQALKVKGDPLETQDPGDLRDGLEAWVLQGKKESVVQLGQMVAQEDRARWDQEATRVTLGKLDLVVLQVFKGLEEIQDLAGLMARRGKWVQLDHMGCQETLVPRAH